MLASFLNFASVQGTSSKMDFLPLASVRTDPVMNPTCLSDHVHTFYGANASLRPETSYAEMRNANGNSGNVEENKSLYWHPTIYKYDPDTGVYTKVDICFASAYYVWTTGQAEAFPDGFQMIVKSFDNKSRVLFDCNGPSECERVNCTMPSADWKFPQTACSELEIRIVFPTCWDGRLSSDDYMSHVTFDLEDGGSFDGACPSSHPRKLPEVQFYFRVLNYEGGHHLFSDGTDDVHADYFSGWNKTQLQYVLDTCQNDGEAAMPDKWCEDYLTFRDAPKSKGDDNIVTKLQPLQPSILDPTIITDELITGITTLPRGVCKGTLKSVTEQQEDEATTTDHPVDEAEASATCHRCQGVSGVLIISLAVMAQ